MKVMVIYDLIPDEIRFYQFILEPHTDQSDKHLPRITAEDYGKMKLAHGEIGDTGYALWLNCYLGNHKHIKAKKGIPWGGIDIVIYSGFFL